MKWINHMLIGGSLAIAFNPIMLPIALAGSTAPDWLESLAHKFKYPLKHRAQTHYLVIWVTACLCTFFIIDFHGIFFWFAVGGLSHILADSLTVMGIPVGWWSEKRFHLFGGRLRTGEKEEYFVSGGVMLVALLIGYGSGHLTSNTFFPFFYQWHELYQNGIIDGYEWKQNRFRFI